MKYSFREIVDPGSGKKFLVMDFDDKKYDILSEFLFTEATLQSGRFVLEFLDSILSGIAKPVSPFVDPDYYGGNGRALEASRDKTLVIDELAPDGMGDYCEVDTKKLRELVEVWLVKLAEFTEAQTQNH